MPTQQGSPPVGWSLAQGCGVNIAGPNEILLGQPELVAKLVGIPLGSPSALLVEGGSGLGLLVLGGHGRQRSAADWALALMSGPWSRNRIFSSKLSPMVIM